MGRNAEDEEAGGRGAEQGTAARGGQQRGTPYDFGNKKTMRLGIKLARVSTWQNYLEKNRRWNKAPLADRKKWDGRESRLGAVVRSRKMRTGKRFKTTEVMPKTFSPGKVAW